MPADRPLVATTFPVATDTLARQLGEAADVQTVARMSPEERARTLRAADVLLALNWRAELRPEEGPELGVQFVQLLSAAPTICPSISYLRGR